MSLPAPISTEITLSLVVPGDEPLPVDATLHYRATDPYAVHLDIHTGDGAITWSFARELLTAGVDGPAGEGDVHITPITRRHGRSIRIQLSSPDGTAALEASLPEMVQFLTSTYTAVPSGCENDHVDLDREIAQLLV